MLRKGLTFIALLFVAISAHAATIVQAVCSEEFGNPINITVSAIGSGNTVVAGFQVPDGTHQTGLAVYDNVGTSGTPYTQDYIGQNAGADGDVFYFRRNNVTGGPTTVTIDPGDDLFAGICVWELSGVANGAPVASNRASANDTSPTVNLTSVTANAVVLGYIDTLSGRTFTAGSGYTKRVMATEPAFASAVDDADTGASGTVTVNATMDSGTLWAINAVAYSATGGASSGLLLRRRRS